MRTEARAESLRQNSTYYTGGRTTVDDVRKNDRQENVRLGIAVQYRWGGGL